MARKKEKKGPSKIETPEWMVTYGDMTTLLLTFFVLLFTTATVDGQDLQLILSSFRGAFGIQTGGLTLEEGPLAFMGQSIESLPSSDVGESLAEMTQEEVSLKQDIEEEGQVEIVSDERGLKIMLLGDAFFREGSASLTKRGMDVINRVGDFIRRFSIQGPASDYEIVVSGHTDNLPVRQTTIAFSDNWELSVLRSTAVINYWTQVQNLSEIRTTVDGRRTNKFRAEGLAYTKPIATNDTPEGRSRNRRIEIIIKKNNN